MLVRNQPSYPHPASGVLSDEEDHVLGVDPVAFGMDQLGRTSSRRLPSER